MERTDIMKRILFVAVALASLTAPAWAQRGTGEDAGIVRQGLSPDILTVTGTVADLKIEPCAMTTGRSIVGAHILLATPDGTELNIHLGPATDLADLVADVQKGDSVTASVFRTDRLPADAYIARDLTIDDASYILRDASLRPVWAGGRAGTNGQGRGMGPGRGMGRGPGAGCCGGGI